MSNQKNGQNMFDIFSPIWPLECPEKGKNNSSILLNVWQHRITWKFATFVGYYCWDLQFLTFFAPIWRQGCPKKDQNLRFALNEWKYKISDEKLYLCINLQFLCIIFRGMDNFWPFCPPSPTCPLGCPKTSQKCRLTK